MNLFYIILFGPVALAMICFALLVKWALIAPYKAWQNVVHCNRERKRRMPKCIRKDMEKETGNWQKRYSETSQ